MVTEEWKVFLILTRFLFESHNPQEIEMWKKERMALKKEKYILKCGISVLVQHLALFLFFLKPLFNWIFFFYFTLFERVKAIVQSTSNHGPVVRVH